MHAPGPRVERRTRGVSVEQPAWGQTRFVWKEGGVSPRNVNTSKQSISLLAAFLIGLMNKSKWRLVWSPGEYTSVSFTPGLLVIGTFIKASCLQRAGGAHMWSQQIISSGTEGAVSHPAHHWNNHKSCCSHHDVPSSFFLPNMWKASSAFELGCSVCTMSALWRHDSYSFWLHFKFGVWCHQEGTSGIGGTKNNLDSGINVSV